jgi:hypothetical protein
MRLVRIESFLLCAVVVAAPITAGAATLQLPTLTVPSIPQHSYNVDGFGSTHITDFLHVTSNASSYTSGSFTGTYAPGDTLVQKFAAPAGKRFALTFNPAAFQPSTLSFESKWRVIGTTPSFNPSTFSSATFENLTGTAPAPSGMNSFVEDDYIDQNWAGGASSSLTFTAINLSLQVPAGGGKPTAAAMTLDSFFINSSATFLTSSPDAVYFRIENVPEPAALAIFAAFVPLALRRRRG